MTAAIRTLELTPTISEAATRRQRLAAAALADRIYCEEHLGMPWAEGRALVADPEAALAASRVLIATFQGEVVATVFIHAPCPERAEREGTRLGLPVERHLDLREGAERSLVQISHAACHPRWRGQGVSGRLWRRALALTADREVVVVAATGLREAGAAAGLWAQLRERAPGWRSHLRDPERGAGEVPPQDVAVPWLLESYQRLGLRPLGEPVFFPRFGMFDLPMWMPARA